MYQSSLLIVSLLKIISPLLPSISYNKAVEAKKGRPVKPTQAYGAKGQRAITTSNQVNISVLHIKSLFVKYCFLLVQYRLWSNYLSTV